MVSSNVVVCLASAGLERYANAFAGTSDERFCALLMQDYGGYGLTDLEDKQKLFRLLKVSTLYRIPFLKKGHQMGEVLTRKAWFAPGPEQRIEGATAQATAAGAEAAVAAECTTSCCP